MAEEEGDYNRLFHPQTSLMVKQGDGAGGCLLASSVQRQPWRRLGVDLWPSGTSRSSSPGRR